MHLVVDMQGAQTGSRFRGIGRLTLSLVKAIINRRGEHQVTLALSGLFPDSIPMLTEEFSKILPTQEIRVWHGVGPTNASSPENNWRREISEKLREAFIASLRPDVVLITSLFEGYADNAVHSVGLLKTNIPTAAIFYDLIPLNNPGPEFQSNHFQQVWYQGRLDTLRKCQRLLSISEFSRREAIDELALDSDRVDTIYCGCDPSFRDVALSATEKNATFEKHSIRKPFVMYTGGGDVSKNLGRLILAFARLDADQRDRHQLVFAGKIEHHDVGKLQAIARASGMNPNDLLLLGFVPDEDLIRLYGSCSAFVLPSLQEGFGLPLLEAMACGAPVVASHAASIPEVVGLEEALFDPLSIESISLKLEAVLTQASFRERLITHGKEQAKKFTWDHSAQLAWKSLLSLGGSQHAPASPLLNVDRTGIFGKRQLRILAIKLDHLGDFILAIPALAKLRAKYPYAEIDVLVGSWNVSFARALGYFRNVHAFDYFKRKSSNKPSANDDELLGVISGLDKYDFAIDLRRQPESRFVLVRTNAKLKVGYQTFDEAVDAQLDVMLKSYKEGAHIRTPLNRTPIGRQILSLIDALPGDINDFVSLPAIAPDVTCVSGRVSIFPKAGTDAREWGRERILQLAAQLAESTEVEDIHVFFVNATEAAEYGIAHGGKLHVHVGLEFAALVQLLAGSSLCIANNSGGIHLASYLGVPVIGIYSGHEMAAEWGPQFHNSVAIHRNADCSPCHLGRKIDCAYGNFCLEDISVQDIFQKSLETLSAGTHIPVGGDGPSAAHIRLQLNADAIVDDLIESMAVHLDPADAQSQIDVSIAVARNHPAYSLLRESELDYSRTVNVDLDHRSKALEWLGFGGAEPAYRWSDGRNATMRFFLEDEGEVPTAARLLLVVDTFRKQRIIIRFNGVHYYDEVKTGKRILIQLPVNNLRYGLNKLELKLPNAASPGTNDTRLLGVAVRTLKIAVGNESLSGVVRRAVQPLDWMIRLR